MSTKPILHLWVKENRIYAWSKDSIGVASFHVNSLPFFANKWNREEQETKSYWNRPEFTRER